MSVAKNIFHLAIPCKDLNEAQCFYVEKLGYNLARKYADRVTLNFLGNQLVCHLSPEDIDPTPKMYPRHFGITFERKEDFDALFVRAKEQDIEFFQKPMVRFLGKVEEHSTFFLKDPSNNLLEFKLYNNPEMIY